jgi:hypothetical protein
MLRAHSRLNNIGCQVLQANHFLKISTRYPKLCQLFQNNTGFAWTASDASLGCIKWAHFFVKVHPRLASVPATIRPKSFMLCQADIDILIQTLNMVVLANDPHLAFEFLVARRHDEGLPAKIQGDVLLSFTTIRGFDQGCATPALDPILARKLRSKLEQRVYWSRADHRQLLNVMSFKHQLVVEPIKNRKWLTALNHQQGSIELRGATIDMLIAIVSSADKVLTHDMAYLGFLDQANSILIHRQLSFLTRDLNNARRLRKALTESYELMSLGEDLSTPHELVSHLRSGIVCTSCVQQGLDHVQEG